MVLGETSIRHRENSNRHSNISRSKPSWGKNSMRQIPILKASKTDSPSRILNSETSIRHRENSNRHSNISRRHLSIRAQLGQELYEANPHSESLKNGLAISYSKLGDIYQAQGKFEQALQYFEKETDLFQELYEANPHSESLKNGLAISYEKLGDIYQAQGKFEQALQYFERRAQLGQELYEANPHSESLKNGLAILEKQTDLFGKLD